MITSLAAVLFVLTLAISTAVWIYARWAIREGRALLAESRRLYREATGRDPEDLS